MYVSKAVNTSSTTRVGIFAHYTKTGPQYYKWALIFEPPNLELVDAWTSFAAVVPCTLGYNVWYTMNMTIHGLQVNGWASTPGQTCSVSGSYSASSPAISGTAFGLYAGGYSALCDNVTVATVSPSITTTGFSKSFFNSSPGPNVHDALAGTAELQNGTSSAPIETYYSYWPWGGLNQTKQLCYWQTGTQWFMTTGTYDTYGNPSKTQDPRGNYTYYSFSSIYENAFLTNQTQVLVPGGTRITKLYSYNMTMGTLLSTVDPNGYNTTYRYDLLGRTTAVNYPHSLGYVDYTYNDTANYVDSINENGWKTRQYYDGLGRLGKTTRFLNGVPYSNETFTHNWQDKIVTDNNPLGNKIAYQYDPLGRVTSTTEPNGNLTQIVYNDTASWIQTIDESGVRTCNANDRLGRLWFIFENATTNCSQGIFTIYAYYEVGDLVKVSSTNVADQYSYDNLNRVTSVLHLDRTTESYLYDNNSNMVSWTNRNGVVTTYSYDSMNRLTSKTYHGTVTSADSYSYDGSGNLLMLQSQNSTISYTYDQRNRMTCEIYQVNRGIPGGPCYNGTNPPASGTGHPAGYSYSYYYSGENMIQLTYNDFMTANYVYDGLGRAANVSYSSPMVTTSFSYYQTDQLKGIHYANGLVENYTYDKNSRTQQIKLLNGTTTSLLLNYQYNKTGTVASVSGQSITTTGATVAISESYRYDALERLTNSTTTTGNTIAHLWYMYDLIGNRLAQGLNGTSTGNQWQKTTYSYNTNNNELSSSTSSGVTTSFGYDHNGNLQTKNVTSSHGGYTWNVQGQLLKVTNNSIVQGFYAYDGLGRRVESKENSYYYFYGYLGTETLGETGTFGPDNDYVYANGLRIAMVNDATGNNPTVIYYHTDALGSTRLVTSSSKHVLFSDSYQPFGQDNSTTGSQTYKFTGKPVSQTTGLYYDYQRWFDPNTGRFLSRDVAPSELTNPQTLNDDVYVFDNPSSYIDPDGAAPVAISALMSFVGFYHALTRSISVQWSFLSPQWWGDWHVGGPDSHVIWSAGRPDYPGVRQEDILIGKLDRPNLLSLDPSQTVFHFVNGEGDHLRVSDSIGRINEGIFDYGDKVSKVLLVAGLAVSAWDVWSAYQQGGPSSALRAGVEEAGGWAGAWLGGELGAAIGTAAFPGVGTVIGGLAGAIIGGIAGQQGIDYLYSIAASALWTHYGVDQPTMVRGPI